MPDGMPRSRGEMALYNRKALREEAAKLILRLGPTLSRRRVGDALGLHHTAVDRLFPTDADLLFEVISDHLQGLAQSVWQEFHADAPAGPLPRLEAMILAWLHQAQAEPHAHHAFCTAIHILPAELRDNISRNFRSLWQSMQEAVCAAVPGLADRPEAAAVVMQCLRRLLADAAWAWDPEDYQATALGRRITGMILAAGRAEVAGSWPDLGATSGVRHNLLIAEAAVARARLSRLLDHVASGSEAIIMRRGKRLAKLVRAE